MTVRLDTTLWNVKQYKIQNKNARWNFNIADFNQRVSMTNIRVKRRNVLPIWIKRGRCINRKKRMFWKIENPGRSPKELSYISTIYWKWELRWFTSIGIEKISHLFAEANVSWREPGIGFHGDSERKMVIGMNIGRNQVRYLEYQARNNGCQVGKRASKYIAMTCISCAKVHVVFRDENSYKTTHHRHRRGTKRG